jgi:hypothetical protein
VPTPVVEVDDSHPDVCVVTVRYEHELMTGGFLGIDTTIPLATTSSMIIE